MLPVRLQTVLKVEIGKTMRNIYHLLVVCFFINAIALFLLTRGQFGPFRVFEYNKSLVLATVQYAESYSAGDMVAFYVKLNGKKIIKIHTIDKLGGNVYIVENKILLPRLIVGRVFIEIPFAGYVLFFVRSFIGMVILLYIPASIIIFVEARWQWRHGRSRQVSRNIGVG